MSPYYDEENHPYIYAQGEEAVVKVNIQTKEVREVIKVESDDYFNAFELISDENGSMFTAEKH